jgi:hypothetical protein
MMTHLEDLPKSESSSRLLALGVIERDKPTARIEIIGREFEVPIHHRVFPNGGVWSFFLCSCGRRARYLRLLGGELRCKYCCEAAGVKCRGASLSKENRLLARDLGPLEERLASMESATLRPRTPGSRMRRRMALETALAEAKLKKRLIQAERQARTLRREQAKD